MQDQVVHVGKGKQIIASRTPVKAVYRFFGREIYLKANSQGYSDQLIAQVRAKGGIVDKANGWLRVNMFGDHDEVKLGGYVFNPKTTSVDKIAEISFNFFKSTLEAQGFKVEVSDI